MTKIEFDSTFAQPRGTLPGASLRGPSLHAPSAPQGGTQSDLRARLLADWANVEIPAQAAALAGQRVLLSGTSGQLGLWLLRMLLKAGAEVEATHFRTPMRGPEAPALARLRWHAADLTDPAALAGIGALPETVMFCAPLWHLTPQLPALAQGGVRRLVAFGSTSMHVKGDSALPGERALVARLQASEAALRAWAEETGAQAVVLRPTMIYGVGLDANVAAVARTLRRLRFFPVAVRAHGLRQPAHLDDLARAALALLAPGKPGFRAYDLSGGEALPYHAFVARIAALPGVGGRALPVPFLAEALDLAGRLTGRSDKLHGEIARRMGQDLAFSHQAARDDFGYAPRGFLDMARQPEGLAFV